MNDQLAIYRQTDKTVGGFGGSLNLDPPLYGFGSASAGQLRDSQIFPYLAQSFHIFKCQLFSLKIYTRYLTNLSKIMIMMHAMMSS